MVDQGVAECPSSSLLPLFRERVTIPILEALVVPRGVPLPSCLLIGAEARTKGGKALWSPLRLDEGQRHSGSDTPVATCSFLFT